MRNSLLKALAVAAGLIAGAPAFARSEPSSVSVRHADLDLTHAAGRAALNRRIAAAARRVCGFQNSRELTRAIAERRCVDDAIAGSQPAVLALIEKRSAVRVAQASTGRDDAAR